MGDGVGVGVLVKVAVGKGVGVSGTTNLVAVRQAKVEKIRMAIQRDVLRDFLADIFWESSTG